MRFRLAGAIESLLQDDGEYEATTATAVNDKDICLMALNDPAARAAQQTFAAAFRDARKSAGLTQTQVAVRAGVSVNHVSAIENGRHDPRFVTMVKLVEAVGKRLEIRLIDPPPQSRKRKS